MKINKYNIGDKLWYASNKRKSKTTVCPECLGDKYITVILGDKTELKIDCTTCQSGYDPPKGYIIEYDMMPDVLPIIIKGIEIERDGIRYTTESCYIINENCLYKNRMDAEKRSIELIKEYNAKGKGKINLKEKNSRSWAWHVTYHRQGIKRAEHDLTYHKAKLEISKNKSK